MLVFADVAQLVEQHIRNVKVASSIPAIGTSNSMFPVHRGIQSNPRSRYEMRVFLFLGWPAYSLAL
jgi:hypothetical protein